jgi:sigma-B regulation protein RsbU (phosphoserine phosphatase)
MRILIAEDDRMSCHLLQRNLTRWGHEVTVTSNGSDAWNALNEANAPHLAILDWMMPGMDGVEVCRRLRAVEKHVPVYVILLTAKGRKADIVEGLIAGANDYVTKPFDREELQARIRVGQTVIELQQKLADRVMELEEALVEVKVLQGILPICSYCRHIRNDQNYWQEVECYISEHSEAKFSHSICPQCYDSVVKPQLEARRRERENAFV